MNGLYIATVSKNTNPKTYSKCPKIVIGIVTVEYKFIKHH
jgi:hypothetical protein